MPRSRRRATKKPKSRKQPPAKTEWYTIRRILDEKVEDGQVQYLVDWDDNIVTGEAYDPTWSVEVTDVAKQEWEETKAERARQNQQPLVACAENSDGSQPPRPANWRQLARAHTSNITRRRSASSTLSPDRPRKIPRLDSGPTPSEEPVPSFASTASAGTPSEVPESFVDEESAIPQQVTSVVVEIPKDPNFDPTEYLSVIDSQKSGHSTQSLAELEDEDSRVAVSSHLSQGTIPDSQEVSDRSWSQFHIPGTQASLVAPAVNQPQTSQLSYGLCVIPDSVEQLPRTVSQSSAEAVNRQRSPSLSCLSPPGQVREDIAQASEAIESDIPSHQPDQLRAAIAKGPELSELVAHEASASSLSGPAVSTRRVVSEQTQSGASPVYLTQPPVSIAFNIPESSVNSQVLEFPYCAVFEATSARNHQAETLLDQRESQAAQIVRQDFDSADQKLTPSETIQEDSAPVAVLSQPEEVSVTPVTPSRSSAGVVSSPKRIPNRNQSRAMDPERRLTVAEELAKIFQFDPIFPESATSSTNDNAQPERPETVTGNGPDTESHDKAPASHAELPVRSPELTLVSQPFVDVETKPSSPGVSGNGQAAESEVVVPVSSTNKRKSVAEELHEIFNYGLSVGGFSPLDPLPDRSQQVQQETVSLADITRQAEPGYDETPLAPLSSIEDHDPVPLPAYVEPIEPDEEQDGYSSDDDKTPSLLGRVNLDHIVTLPFHARQRPLYDETIMEYRPCIKEFGKIFSSEQYSEPDESLVNQIDELFSRLFTLCDYPQDMVGAAFEELTPAQQAKYCCDANPKFSFVFEFLQGVQPDYGILIVAGSLNLLRLLCNLAEALKMEFRCDALAPPTTPPHHSRLVFALPTQDIDLADFDAIIGFDHSFNCPLLAGRLSESFNRQQLIMMLVTTYSIEQLDILVPEGLSEMERKNALLSAIVRARKLVTDPNRGHPEPHEAAATFYDFINGEENVVLWRAEKIPHDVLDVFVDSQSRSQLPIDFPEEQENGRKRKLDYFGDSEVKRMRVEHAAGIENEPPLPDDVRTLLDSSAPMNRSSRPEVLVKVPLSVLETLTEKFSEYERRKNASNHDSEYHQGIISGLEKRIKEYERTTRKVYESQRTALQDRSRYEAEKRKVEASMQAAAEQAKKEAEKAQKRISELESALARLTEDPNASDPQDTPLARTEKLLQEAEAKIGTLEKRLENAHEDGDYVRNLYQDASASASAMKTENNQLKRQNEELRKTSADNFVRIHEIQEQSTVKIYLGQIAELKAQTREREMELDRARDELRQLKNGRRETRQVSVPRSPRMGMMSPRTGRGYGGPASRASSPATGGIDGMQFLGQQSGNGRWNHLRD